MHSYALPLSHSPGGNSLVGSWECATVPGFLLDFSIRKLCSTGLQTPNSLLYLLHLPYYLVCSSCSVSVLNVNVPNT